MQIRIFLQRSEYDFQREEYCKNKTKFALLSQYSMSFTGQGAEVLYIIVSIKLDIAHYVDIGHYICDVLYNSTVTWCDYDDDKITKHSGYPNNVYDNLSKDNEKKGWILL